VRALAGIALNTFRETTREPFYYLLLAAGIAALVITLFFPLFTFYHPTDMYKDIGLSFVLLFVLLSGLLAAATGVAREVEARTAQTVLAKSGVRWTFILGKYLGVLASVAAALALLGVVLVVAVYYRVERDASVLERPYTLSGLGEEVEAFRWRQINQALTVTPGLVLVGLQVAVLAAVATALSARFSAAASVGLALGAFVVGHLIVFLESATRHAGAGVRATAEGILTVVPFLEIFNLNDRLSRSILAPVAGTGGSQILWGEVWTYVGLAALYAAAYVVAALALAMLLFRRRSLA